MKEIDYKNKKENTMTLAKDIASHLLKNPSSLPQTRGALSLGHLVSNRRFILTTV